MQRKRNIQLLISLASLLVITAIVLYSVAFSEQEVVDRNIFKVENLKSVDRVVLGKASQSVELKLEGTRWKVNGKSADVNLVDVLFATLQQAEVKRPVASSLQDSVRNQLNKNGVKVSLYEGEQLVSEFVAGGNRNKTQAYFMNEDESYVMVIPGYRVYTAGIFELDEEGWLDKYIFNFNWRNFKQLKVSFPGNPKNDFEVAMGKQYFEVKGLEAVDTTKLNDFLDAISLTTVDQYVKKDEINNWDSLTSTSSQMLIEVYDISGKTYSLALFDRASPGPLLGIIHGSQLAYISRQRVNQLMKDRSWFIKK